MRRGQRGVDDRPVRTPRDRRSRHFESTRTQPVQFEEVIVALVDDDDISHERVSGERTGHSHDPISPRWASQSDAWRDASREPANIAAMYSVTQAKPTVAT